MIIEKFIFNYIFINFPLIMHVCLIYRSLGKGVSIENVFSIIEKELKSKIVITKYIYDSNKSLLFNLRNIYSLKADLYHITGDINWITFFLNGSKVINTIHDIGTLKTLNGFKKIIYKYIWIYFPIKFSRHTTVVSSFTKSQILFIFKSLENKISIIHNPINQHFLRYDKKINVDNPCILIIGTAKHKNIEITFKVLKHFKNITLNIVGKLNPDQKLMLDQYGISFNQFVNISNTDIYELYKLSDLLIFSSLHEGFGLPIIEANAIGVPIICSFINPIYNIASNSALFFDPLSEQDLFDKINLILNSHDLRKTLIENGFLNSEKFKSTLITEQYLQLYRKVFLNNEKD